MGAVVGGVLVAAGQRVVWAADGRSAATAERAGAAGLEDAGTLAELAEQADVVLSICPPHEARRSRGPGGGPPSRGRQGLGWGGGEGGDRRVVPGRRPPRRLPPRGGRALPQLPRRRRRPARALPRLAWPGAAREPHRLRI